MKKIIKKPLIYVVLCVSLLLGGIQQTFAASELGKVYYFTGTNCLGAGTTSNIVSRLSGMEYGTTRSANPSRSTVLNAFGSATVLHILTHGGAGLICIGASNSGSTITYSNISSSYSSLSNLRFVFFEACSVAANSNMQNTLRNLGVSSSLAFKNTVTAGTDSNGIHYYAQRVYYHLARGYTTSYAALKAKTETYENQGNQYWGSDSYSIYGIETKLTGN